MPGGVKGTLMNRITPILAYVVALFVALTLAGLGGVMTWISTQLYTAAQAAAGFSTIVFILWAIDQLK